MTVHQDILRLQVTMGNVQLVTVTHSFDQGLHHSTCFTLVIELLLDNLLEELTAIHQLGDNVVVVLIVVEALQTHDVLVVQLSINAHANRIHDP